MLENILHLFFGLSIIIVAIMIFYKYPYVVAFTVLFLSFYNFNIETPLPLDFRGIMVILLFIRFSVLDSLYKNINQFLIYDKVFMFIIIFIVYSTIISLYIFHDLQYFKQMVVNIIYLLLGFFLVLNRKGRLAILFAIICAGLFCVADLFYSYTSFNVLGVKRILDSNSSDAAYINHNFFGFNSAIAFIYIFLLLLRRKANKIILLLLLFLFGCGIILSTSRSSILATILVIGLLFFLELSSNITFAKIIKNSILYSVILIIAVVLFNVVFSQMNLSSNLLQKVKYRLIDEPASIIGSKEQSIALKEGTIKWRYYRSLRDLKKFSMLPLNDIVFGIGVNGYMLKKYSSDNLNAHNGFVLLLVERGIIGFFLYMAIIIYLIYKTYRLNRRVVVNLPIMYIFLSVLLYAAGQNSELTSNIFFFLAGGILGNYNSIFSSFYKENQVLQSN